MRMVAPALAAVLFYGSMGGVHADAAYPLSAGERSIVTRFTITATVPMPASADPGAPLDVWIPIPADDGWQSVTDVTITSPAPYAINRERAYGDRMAYVHVDHPSYPVAITAAYTVRRTEPRGLAPGGARVRSRFPAITNADQLVPVGGRFGDLADQIVAADRSAVDRERDIFRSVVANFHYDYDKSSPHYAQGDSAFVCDYKRGNCSDFHSYMTSLSRSLGIPAVMEFGYPLTGIPVSGEIPADGSVSGYHCWLWFESDGRWLPVDAADARRWEDAGRGDVRDYLFGNLLLPRSAVAVSRGRDIRLVPAQKGAPLNYFIYPYAEAGGKTVHADWAASYHLLAGLRPGDAPRAIAGAAPR